MSISSTSPRQDESAPTKIKPTPMAVDEDAASILIGVSVSSLQKKRVNGTGPAYAKIGARVRYRIADLDAYLADCVITSTSEAA